MGGTHNLNHDDDMINGILPQKLFLTCECQSEPRVWTCQFLWAEYRQMHVLGLIVLFCLSLIILLKNKPSGLYMGRRCMRIMFILCEIIATQKKCFSFNPSISMWCCSIVTKDERCVWLSIGGLSNSCFYVPRDTNTCCQVQLPQHTF